MSAHLSCQVQPLKDRRTAASHSPNEEIGVWLALLGLARCTGPDSRTVVHPTDEPSGTLMSEQSVTVPYYWCLDIEQFNVQTLVNMALNAFRPYSTSTA